MDTRTKKSAHYWAQNAWKYLGSQGMAKKRHNEYDLMAIYMHTFHDTTGCQGEVWEKFQMTCCANMTRPLWRKDLACAYHDQSLEEFYTTPAQSSDEASGIDSGCECDLNGGKPHHRACMFDQ